MGAHVDPTPKALSIGTLRAALMAFLVFFPAISLAGLERQAAILTRAFSYDYNLKSRVGESVVLAILFKPGDSASEAMAEAWFQGFQPLQGMKLQGLSFNAVKVPYEGTAALRATIGKQGIDILLVCEKLDADLGGIKDVSHTQKVMTVASKEDYVQQGLSLGVFAKGDQTIIEINLPATGLEGVAFSSELLSLAKVIKSSR